ncbi:MAG: hypothetical protein KCHDKBKB_00273 [Elusimicrobia bacterium]|nr:hypothetical protein [Elusimicrobiota bacterium]
MLEILLDKSKINQNRKFIVNGREFGSLQSLAREYGLSNNTVSYRLSKGWTPDEAIGLQPRPSHAGNTPGIAVKVQGLEFSNIKYHTNLAKCAGSGLRMQARRNEYWILWPPDAIPPSIYLLISPSI